jgi:hypothetical protein
MRIRILLFSSLTFKLPTKNYFFIKSSSAYYFLKVHLHHFQRQKVQKKSKRRNQGFSYYFCLMIRIHICDWWIQSGSRRPKNMWIRLIRIRNTASNYCLTTCLHYNLYKRHLLFFAPRGILILWLVPHNLCISYSFPCLLNLVSFFV